jgi:hypothetical protein
MTDQAPDRQAREFAAAFRGFLDWVHSTVVEDNEVRRWRGISWDLVARTTPW